MVTGMRREESMKNKIKDIKDDDAPSPRRTFLLKLWFGLCLAAFFELVWLIASFLRPRSGKAREEDFGAVIEAGPVEGFLPDSVTAFPRGHFYLVRLEDGGFLAIHRRCTHLGCTVPWIAEEKRFECPCHASAFDIRGNVIRTPASRALDIFPITLINDTVWVDTGKPEKRSVFRPEQVVYPEKNS